VVVIGQPLSSPPGRVIPGVILHITCNIQHDCIALHDKKVREKFPNIPSFRVVPPFAHMFSGARAQTGWICSCNKHVAITDDRGAITYMLS